MCIAVFFVIVPNWKLPRYFSTDELNKLWNINTTEHYSAMKKNERSIHSSIQPGWSSRELCGVGKKPLPKGHILYDYIIWLHSGNDKIIEMGNRLVIARGQEWQGGKINERGNKRHLCGNGNVLYFNYINIISWLQYCTIMCSIYCKMLPLEKTE